MKKIIKTAIVAAALSVGLLTNAYAATGDNETIIWEYEQALEQALKVNTSLRDLAGSIEVMEEQKEQLDDSYDQIRQNNPPFNSTVGTVLSSLREIESMLGNIAVTKAQIAEATNVALKSMLVALNGYRLDVDLLENHIALQEIGLRHITLKHSLGMESDYNLSTAQSNLEQAKLNLETLQKSIESQKLSINNLLGLAADTDLHIEYSSIELLSLDVDLAPYIQQQLKKDPSIKQKQTACENAVYVREQYNTFSRYTVNPITNELLSEDKSYIRMDSEVSATKRALDDTKRNIEKVIRQTYNQLRQLEKRHESLMLDLDKANETYNAALINYQVGMITNYDVEQAKLGILNAEIAILKNIDNYQMALLIFENPYMGV